MILIDTAKLICLFILIILWIYFFFLSYQRKTYYPWGFCIVLIGILISGYGYSFRDSNNTTMFSMDLSFALTVLGIFVNVGYLRNQVNIKPSKEFFNFIALGILFGVLSGFVSLVVLPPNDYMQLNVINRTITSVLLSLIQISIAEEILFRGYLLNYLKQYEFNSKFVIVFQALIFTFLHFSRYVENWIMLLTIFVWSCIVGYLVWKSENLISAFCSHILFGLVPVLWWLFLIG